MIKVLLSIVFFCVCLSVPLAAQSVVISPRKVVYTRPRATTDLKKTFTIVYPKVKASSPALSRKIEQAASYPAVLGLNVREELTESQWLEEADYEVHYNAHGILVITLSMNGTAAYADGTSKTVAVDLRSGFRLRPADVFVKRESLIDKLAAMQRTEIDAAINEMKKDPEAKDVDPAELFVEEKFTADHLQWFAIDDAGVTFIYDYGFPHVLEGYEPEGRYKFSWNEIATFVKVPGPLAHFVSK